MSDAEVVAVAFVAAKYFHNDHKNALEVMQELGYLSDSLSPSCFNRRLPKLSEWVEFRLLTLAKLYTGGDEFVMDSMPISVCPRVRAWHNKKVPGRAYCVLR